MPTDLVTVDRVIVTPTQKEGVTRYDITAHVVHANLGLTYETINPWTASLCQQAARMGMILQITWDLTKYGKEIRTAKVAYRAD